MAKSSTIKIVIDTNLWISFIISNKFVLLDQLLHSNKIRILFSEELIEEIASTIAKPKLKKYFTGNALEEMLTQFEPYIDLIKVKKKH